LEQLADIDCRLYISTKSSLILRDIELLKLQKDVIVDVSLNTLDPAPFA
jgi:DNA repair photolyase